MILFVMYTGHIYNVQSHVFEWFINGLYCFAIDFLFFFVTKCT